MKQFLEEIAKLASRAKFDDFFVGSVSRKVTYPIGHRHFARNPNPTKKARIWLEWSFVIPSLSLFLIACTPILAHQEALIAEAEAINPALYTVVEDQAALPALNPSLASRTIEKLVLKNGLEIYLVSDPDVDQSAAGLAVEAGSWQDPKKYPGLAHFLEHMLFMGNEAYPKEFEYMQFISDHGGKVNAYTAPDRTVYMFSINNDAFQAALDRFSHFFIDPLFLPNSIDRELHAVDQEHSKNIEHDGWRQYMILKETGNPEHPNCSFSTGNAATLSGIPQEALKDWYKSHYSANRMHLAIVSPLPIEEIRALAVQNFSKVASFQVNERPIPSELTSKEQRGHMIFIKPIKDIKQLSLTWEVSSEFASDIDRKAPEIIAYALGQEGGNSLIDALKKEKIAEGIHVTCDRFAKNSLLFSIDISLTDYGLTQIDTAITQTYQAIARLKKEGIPEHLYDELSTMAQINYQYQSRDDAFVSVIRLTENLVYEDLKTYPEKTMIPSTYDPEFLELFVTSLTPDSCLYFVLADPSKTGVLPDTKEKWMHAEYAIKEISSDRLTAWEEMQINPNIQLPQKNPYIPSQLALIPEVDDGATTQTPLLLHSDPGSKVYFAQDTHYRVPEIGTIFSLKSPLINHSPKSQVLTDLYLRALNEKLTSCLFFAQNAGIATSFSSDDSSLKISLQGFSDKAPLLLVEIFEALKSVEPTSEQMEIYRTSLAADYSNASKELPVRQASELLDSIIFKNPTNADKLKAIKELSYADFLDFSKRLLIATYTEAFIYGNIQETDAQTLWLGLQTTLGSTPYFVENQTKPEVLLLSEKYGPYMLTQNTDRQGNGVMLLLEEGDYTFEKRAVQQILGSALKDAFFDTLRTKQQTAYIAKAWDTEKERQLLQYFAVQSSSHHPSELLARFELFLEDFNKNLKIVLPPERFENIRTNVITLLEMPPENMATMLSQLNGLAFDYKDFDWIKRRIETTKSLSYEKFCEIAKSFLSRENSRRLAVLIEGVVSTENDFHYELITKEDVHNFGSFVSVK